MLAAPALQSLLALANQQERNDLLSGTGNLPVSVAPILAIIEGTMAYRNPKDGILTVPTILTFVALLIGGCTVLDQGLFINDTSKPLDVSIVGTQPNPRTLRKQLHIPPQSTSSTTILPCVRLDVRSADGAISYSHEFPIPRPFTVYADKPQRSVTYHYLLTTSGFYPIPFRYWASWQGHRDEILNQQVDYFRCSETSSVR